MYYRIVSLWTHERLEPDPPHPPPLLLPAAVLIRPRNDKQMGFVRGVNNKWLVVAVAGHQYSRWWFFLP